MWQIDLYDMTTLDNNLLEQMIHAVVDVTIITYRITQCCHIADNAK